MTARRMTRSHRPASATILPSPFDVLRTGLRQVFEGYARRAERHQIERMLRFDDQMLRDIGVTRDDVHQALTAGEPSRALACAAQARRPR